MSNDWLYSIFKTHKNVSKFRETLYNAWKCPELSNEFLVSIGRQMHEERKTLSRKQVYVAMDIINKNECQRKFGWSK